MQWYRGREHGGVTSETFWRLLPFTFTKNSNSSCVSASPSTSARPVARSVTPVGSFTALSMASSQMATCPPTRPSGMTPSRPSSPRPVLASTSQEQSSSIWSPLLLTRPDAEHTANCTTLSSSSAERRTPPTTTPEDTTPSERRLSTLFLTESGSWQMLALDSRDSFSSIPSEAAPDLALPPFSWRGCPWTTARRASLSSPSTLHPRSPLPLLNPTTRS